MKDATDKLEYMTLEEAATPRDGTVYTDRWWVAHPEKGLAFYRASPRTRHRAPQCNHDIRMAEHLIASIYPGHVPRYMPVVFLGHTPE